MKWNGEIPLKKKRNRTSNEKQDPKSLYLLFCFSLGSSNPVQKTNVQRSTSNIQYPMKSKSPGTVWSLAFHSNPGPHECSNPMSFPSNPSNSMNSKNPINPNPRPLGPLNPGILFLLNSTNPTNILCPTSNVEFISAMEDPRR